jgi:methionyl aminopeptidase
MRTMNTERRGLRRLIQRRRMSAPAPPILKTPAEIESLRRSGRLVAEAFTLLGEAIAPGVRLIDLDAQVRDFIVGRGAEPLYLGYRGSPPTHPPFPGVICASVNDEICHGIPDERVLADGDIVGIDIGLKLDGWCGDSCVTFPVGTITARAQQLLDVAKTCLELGIRAAQPGKHLGDIGHAVQRHAERHGYSVVTEWGGHGLGRSLHEPPSVGHTGQPGAGLQLVEGMVFTIEPMINEGSPTCVLTPDGWTVVTEDGGLSAQFEHTVAITAHGPRILSA